MHSKSGCVSEDWFAIFLKHFMFQYTVHSVPYMSNHAKPLKLYVPQVTTAKKMVLLWFLIPSYMFHRIQPLNVSFLGLVNA
jgi:hypothetical protein